MTTSLKKLPVSAQKLRYRGTSGGLLRLMLINFALSAITLGIYSFWAKSKVRAYHYGATEIAGDGFVYHGTGGELLIGALKAIGVLLAIGIGMAALMAGITRVGLQVEAPVAMLLIGLPYLLGALIFLVLFAVAVNGTRRYRLSRSSWRGIRFEFIGGWRQYLSLVVKGTLLSVITLGFYRPYHQNHQHAFLVNHARFGSQPFRYDADARELFVAYLKAVLLTLPTLGLCWLWYAAFRQRYFWDHTRIAGVRFRCSVTGGELLGLSLTNFLLVLVTLGIGIPWAMVRAQRFWSDRLRLQGSVDWPSVHQSAVASSAVGEGLAQQLDVDVDVGIAV